MYATDEVTFGSWEGGAVGRAWSARISEHLPYGRLVLLAVATLCDHGAGSMGDRQCLGREVARMTGLDAWKVQEVLRVLARDGHLAEREGRLTVA